MPDQDQDTQNDRDADQFALDTADTAAGYRAVVDEDEQLPADDPNATACDDQGQSIGEDLADDSGVAAARAEFDGGGR